MDFSIIIPYRETDPWRKMSFEWCTARWRAWYPNAEIITADNGKESFDRPGSRNLGVSEAECEILVFADADTFGQKKHIDFAIDVSGEFSWVLPYEVYYNAGQPWSSLITDEDPAEEVDEPDGDYWYDHRLTDSISGIFVTTKSAWNEINGEDERFIGWGYEDRARELALDTLCGVHKRTPGFVVHLWHPAPEENCFGQPNITDNRAYYQRYLSAKGSKTEMKALCNEH